MTVAPAPASASHGGNSLHECEPRIEFLSEREQWIKSKCISIHDCKSPIYELTDDYDGLRALVKNFYMLLDSYQNHPEAKSLSPGGRPCECDIGGLLQRA